MEQSPSAPTLEQRPSLRPLAFVLVTLVALWLTALGLILAQLA